MMCSIHLSIHKHTIGVPVFTCEGHQPIIVHTHGSHTWFPHTHTLFPLRHFDNFATLFKQPGQVLNPACTSTVITKLEQHSADSATL